ncbi:MAG: hydantoinase B/oxoprolinase family protein [Salinirussus sp.]
MRKPQNRSAPAIDPTTVEIIRNALHDIAEEMQTLVMQSAYSPLWQEGGDLSCILLSPDVEIVGRSERAIPIHIATQMSATAAAIEQLGGYDALNPGDVLFHNDPYAGNNHLNDFLTVQPVFVDGELVGFASNRGHWLDVGGSSPSSYATDTGELIQEGICVPPTKLYRAGELNEALYDTVLANVRNPEMREVDFKAQLAGLRRGHTRLRERAEEYGVSTLTASMNRILNGEERRMRDRISELPDGEYAAEDYIDGDGVEDELTRIAVTITVDGDALHADFAGTEPQLFGGVNCPLGVTKTATYYACKVTLDPGPPGSSGIYRPVSVSAPEGSLVNPTPPAPVANGNHETASRVYDVVVKAIGEIDPAIAFGAGAGSSNGFSFSHVATGRQGRHRTISGLGGCACRDGVDAIRSSVGNTAIQSFERTEEDYPFVRTEAFEIVPDSGGAGAHRGGNSMRRTIAFSEDVRVVLTAERTKVAPFGVRGGQDGSTARWIHITPDGERIEKRSKFDEILPGGSKLEATAAGAGGYGSPLDRPPEAVREDVADEYVSIEAARDEYGVAIDTETGEVDMRETARLRDD